MTIRNKKLEIGSAEDIYSQESAYIRSLRAFAQSCVENYELSKPVPVIRKLLGSFNSSSSKGVVYKVYMLGKLINCTCPGYTFRKHCKHTKEFV
jgi:hypothetical protein